MSSPGEGPTDLVVVDPGAGGWIRLCRLDAVPVDRPRAVLLLAEDPAPGPAAVPDPRELPDRDKVCVARVSEAREGVAGGEVVGDRVVAMLDRCPHRDIRLSGGVVGDGLLTCPGHFWRFALTDGRRTDKPDEVATLYPTRVDEEGWVWAEVPARPAKQSMREWLLAQARARES